MTKEIIFPVSNAYKTRYLILPSLEDRLHRIVVGWAKNGPCDLSVFWAELTNGFIDLLVVGGDEGLRILANSEESVPFNPEEINLPPGWNVTHLSLEPGDLPPDVLKIVNTFFYDVGVDTSKKEKKEKVRLLSDIHKTDEVWLVLSSDQKQRRVIGWSKEGPAQVNIFWAKFADDQVSVCVAGGSEGVRIITADRAHRDSEEYDQNQPPGIGAPYLRINYGALPHDVKENIGPEPEAELEEEEMLAKTPPDLDLD
ncbi:MAG: hypothetical protein JSU72_05690 [Deltaproteobacteria bacterium]|nr:MAG: hypothetical protein JSU72_05690 [Deltaproteobacteria bacterium]